MTDIPQLAREHAALKVVADVVKAQQDVTKDQLSTAMGDLGVKSVTAKLPDGTELGSVSLAKGRVAARVKDPVAFANWVAEQYPSEVEIRIRPAFEKSLLDDAKKVGSPVDRHTGEVIPGVEIGQGEPYLTTRLSEDAHGAVLAAIRAGDIQALALPAGEQ